MGKILTFSQYLFENTNQSVIDSFKKAISDTNAEESPRGSNKGPNVEVLQGGVNINPGDPWCAAFIYGVLSKTLFSQEIKNKIAKTGSVQNQWNTTKGKKVINKPNLDINSVLPGMIFCYLSKDKKTGGYPGNGHTGIILSVDKQKKEWTGIEGNANPIDGSREGYGTFIVTRKFADPSISKDNAEHPAKLLGFIDYFSTYRNTPQFTVSLSNSLNDLSNKLLPKTRKEIAYLKANPKVLYDYERNYKNRHKKPTGGSINR